MFDIGFSELMVIAVVALVVIGPERLPTVARTIGALLGRLNRYVADVKTDVEREIRLDEMKKLRAEVEQQAMGIEQSVVKELEATRTAVEAPGVEVQQSLADVMHDTGQTGIELQPVSNTSPPVPVAAPADNLQQIPGRATLGAPAPAPAPVLAGGSKDHAAPQASLDFDAASAPASSARSPAAKA
jgi:sec-independent protein translocase protein TatB